MWHPIYLCFNLETTLTMTVDPVEPLTLVAKRHVIWVRVNATYTRSAFICPEFRHHLNGIEQANSLSLCSHKWLHSFLDCYCLWVQNLNALIKVLGTIPEYLRNK
ncbi:hypothetical protein GQ457_09G024570 [Hibiscus cannabinus]